MQSLILAAVLIAVAVWPGIVAHAQVATLRKAEIPPRFSNATTALNELGDYRVDVMQAKVLKASPLHVQINAEVDLDTARKFPTAMVDEMVTVLTYGIFRMFIHTNAPEVTVTAMPVLQTYGASGVTEKVLKDKAVTVRLTRPQAEQIARDVIGVERLDDLVARETIGWGWSMPMQRTLGLRGGRGVDPAYLKALGLQTGQQR